LGEDENPLVRSDGLRRRGVKSEDFEAGRDRDGRPRGRVAGGRGERKDRLIEGGFPPSPARGKG
jgi:hypothetical protein